MRLCIAIPALDEEPSIRQIIERTLAARAEILERTGLQGIDVVVVSDGSTDRTAEIAREYTDRITLIEFPQNRGYGAAILAGWRASDAELVGFLDADGTCDPRFFADLVLALQETGADVALGSRLHAKSRMPPVRRLGNRIYAWILSAVSLSRVRDVASGMRVVRRAALPALLPLPSGLSFTPAMSTRALLSNGLSIVERDMPYSERGGRSKLSVVRDGWRFLRVILETTFLYRPNRPLGFLALACFILCAVMMAGPTWYYLKNRELQEWMIYRFLVMVLLGTVGVLMLCASHLARKAADISLSDDPLASRYESLFGRLIRPRAFWALPATLTVMGGLLVWHAWRDYWRTGEVYEHWSRFVVMLFFLLLAALLAATKLLDHALNLLAERLAYIRKRQPFDGAERFQPPSDPLF